MSRAGFPDCSHSWKPNTRTVLLLAEQSPSSRSRLIIYYLKHDLERSGRVVGYVLAAATLGTLLAATLVTSARRRLGFGACWIGAWALCGLAIASLGLAKGAIHNTPGSLGVALLTGAAARFGVMNACLVAGTACVLTALAALATPIRNKNPQADPI